MLLEPYVVNQHKTHQVVTYSNKRNRKIKKGPPLTNTTPNQTATRAGVKIYNIFSMTNFSIKAYGQEPRLIDYTRPFGDYQIQLIIE